MKWTIIFMVMGLCYLPFILLFEDTGMNIGSMLAFFGLASANFLANFFGTRK